MAISIVSISSNRNRLSLKTRVEENVQVLTNEHVNCTLSCKFKLKRVHETIRFEMGHFAKKTELKRRSSNLNAGTSCQVLDY